MVWTGWPAMSLRVTPSSPSSPTRVSTGRMARPVPRWPLRPLVLKSSTTEREQPFRVPIRRLSLQAWLSRGQTWYGQPWGQGCSPRSSAVPRLRGSCRSGRVTRRPTTTCFWPRRWHRRSTRSTTSRAMCRRGTPAAHLAWRPWWLSFRHESRTSLFPMSTQWAGLRPWLRTRSLRPQPRTRT